MKANQILRDAAKAAKVPHYKIAKVMGLRPTRYSEMLREELGKEETNKILSLINVLAGEK